MLINIATVILGPLLLLQGKYVRKTTPVLPEAAGEREGMSGTGGGLRLLLIGDSATAGVGAKYQSDALTGQLTGLLKQQYGTYWRLIAKTGATTFSTLKMVQKLQPESFDVVVLGLGVNDVTGMLDVDVWIRQQKELLHEIKSLYSPELIIVNGIPPMHLFPALPQPLRWYLGKKASLMSAALQATIDADEVAVFVPVDFSSDQGMMASDGFHPGPAAYSMWARKLFDVIKTSLPELVDKSAHDK